MEMNRLTETIDLALSIAEYTKYKDEPIVHLFARDKQLNRWHIRLYDFFPYFYVNKEEPIPKNKRIQKVVNVSSNGWKSIKDKPVKKIICKLPEDVGGNRKKKQGLRSRFKTTYEDDIPFNNRVLIDLGIKSGFRIQDNDILDLSYGKDALDPVDFQSKLRRLHLDIEVYK
jgi:DNA polymerase elongation subunit (family B)